MHEWEKEQDVRDQFCTTWSQKRTQCYAHADGHTAEACTESWFSHTSLTSICSVYAVVHGMYVVQHRLIVLSCLQLYKHTQHLSVILISNPNVITENVFFQHWIIFVQSKVIKSFIEAFTFKGNKYKQRIIQCILQFHKNPIHQAALAYILQWQDISFFF